MTDRRAFLATAAAGLVAGPVATAAPPHLQRLHERAARRIDSQRQASLQLLHGVLAIALRIAETHQEQHPAGCACHGCIDDVGLGYAIERRLIPMLEMCEEMIAADVAHRVRLDEGSLADSLLRVVQLAEQADAPTAVASSI